MSLRKLATLWLAWTLLVAGPVAAQAPAPAKIGVVVMHGKGGNPNRLVHGLAVALADQDILVANLEMPWSGRRSYDADVASAERQVQEALDGLRAKGATKLFAAGHSYGGTFALYLGGRLPLDGVIAIAPGGSSDTPVARKMLGASLARARNLVSDGKGASPAELHDYEGSRGLYPVMAVPAAFVTWYDPDGAMNQAKALRALKREFPVLFIVPTGDYPGLLKQKEIMAPLLPRNTHTRLYEPDTDHMSAPGASSAEILRWLREVSKAAP